MLQLKPAVVIGKDKAVQFHKDFSYRNKQGLVFAGSRFREEMANLAGTVALANREKKFPSLGLTEIQSAASKIKVVEASTPYFSSVVEHIGATENNVPVDYTLQVPKKLGISKSEKTGYVLGLIGDAVLAAGVVITTAVVALGGTAFAVLAALGAFIAGAYGVFKIAKNIISSWKGHIERRVSSLASALETVLEKVLEAAETAAKQKQAAPQDLKA